MMGSLSLNPSLLSAFGHVSYRCHKNMYLVGQASPLVIMAIPFSQNFPLVAYSLQFYYCFACF